MENNKVYYKVSTATLKRVDDKEYTEKEALQAFDALNACGNVWAMPRTKYISKDYYEEWWKE